jgi:hypothetical protein
LDTAVVENGGEGTTSEVCEIAARPEALAQSLGDVLQQSISNMLTMSSVDVAETFDIQDDDRGGFANCPLDAMVDVLGKKRPFGEAREGINGAEVADSAFVRQCLDGVGDLFGELLEEQKFRLLDWRARCGADSQGANVPFSDD